MYCTRFCAVKHVYRQIGNDIFRPRHIHTPHTPGTGGRDTIAGVEQRKRTTKERLTKKMCKWKRWLYDGLLRYDASFLDSLSVAAFMIGLFIARRAKRRSTECFKYICSFMFWGLRRRCHHDFKCLLSIH